jgi:low temperature requirement protein LtrA
MRANLLRELKPNEHAHVNFVELFFDLVFVFAVTQLSHALLDHYSLRGAFETLILFMAVWWAWIDTSWVTNWLDPQKRPVRLMLLGLMLAGLVLSASIPEAFGERGLYFAGAYAFLQVSRSLFMMWALKDRDPANFRNFKRITFWRTFASVLWIAGGFVEGDLRIGFWAAAACTDTLAPSIGFRTPGLGRSTTSDWHVEGSHIAHRCGLFLIIAFGESILVTGVNFAGLEWTLASAAAFFAAFASSVAMWWIYFDSSNARGSDVIAHSTDPGRLARLAYTYLHLPIVAGIIVTAVGDEFALMHPTDPVEPGGAMAILGGPALYLAGTTLFRRSISDRWPLFHIAGILILGLLAATFSKTSMLALATLVTLVLVLVAASESLATRTVGSRP